MGEIRQATYRPKFPVQRETFENPWQLCQEELTRNAPRSLSVGRGKTPVFEALILPTSFLARL